MGSLFFIETPFQLIGAYEAISAYNVHKYKIYIRLSNNNTKQLEILVKTLFPNDKNINYFFLAGDARTLLDYFVVIKYLFFISIVQFKYDYVFLGNYESKFLNLFLKVVPKKKIILLDDGIKGFIIQNKFSDIFNYNMFSMLYTLKPFKNQSILYHKFERLKSLIKNDRVKKIKNNEIFFLGTKLAEAGIITNEYYIQIIENILKEYNSFEVIYLPHRGENIQKLAQLQKTYTNFIVKELDYPVELHIIIENTLPFEIISLYSAALLSIKLINPDIVAKSILFDYSSSEFRDSINLVYMNLKDYGVEIIKEENNDYEF